MVSDHQQLEEFEAILEAQYKFKRKFLEMQLERALVTRITNVTDIAANQLVIERAALQLRLDQVTSAARLKLKAGLVAGELFVQS